MIERRTAGDWPALEKWVAQAMLTSLGEDAEDLREQVLRGDAQLWALDDCGAAVTRIVTAKRRILQIVAVAHGQSDGTMTARALDAFKQFARESACEMVLATGRRGWEAELTKHGFRVQRITAIYEVEYA